MRLSLVCAACIFVAALSLHAAELCPEAFQEPIEQLVADTATAPQAVNDRRLQDNILKAAEKFINDGSAAKMPSLIGQLNQKTCQVKLPKVNKKERTTSQIYAQNTPGVLVMSGIFKCDKCAHWHASCASGFVLSESGVAVTNYHVINNPKHETLVAATSDGRVLPVQSVLAASEADDVAIVQLGGDHLQPVPLAADAPVGSKVCAVSHPDGQFYTLTEGIISRYCVHNVKSVEVPKMAITADFARGSSGGPIFDMNGNAVGMVASTISVYYTNDNGKKDNLQMVLKHCVPAASVLHLIEPAK